MHEMRATIIKRSRKISNGRRRGEAYGEVPLKENVLIKVVGGANN